MDLSAWPSGHRDFRTITLTLTMQVVKTLNRSERSAETSRLPVENAVDRWLRRLDLRRQARLTPAGSLLDFPE